MVKEPPAICLDSSYFQFEQSQIQNVYFHATKKVHKSIFLRLKRCFYLLL